MPGMYVLPLQFHAEKSTYRRKLLYQGKCTSMQNRKSRIQLSVHQMGAVKGSDLPTGLEDNCPSLHLPQKEKRVPLGKQSQEKGRRGEEFFPPRIWKERMIISSRDIPVGTQASS